MADLDKAVATQLSNIEKRTGKSLAELTTLVQESGLSRHGELVAMLKSTLGMGHGDANLLVHVARTAGGPSPAPAQERSVEQVLDELYAGPKATLRPIHERLLEELGRVGACEWVPKKSYISYRRKKQFAIARTACRRLRRRAFLVLSNTHGGGHGTRCVLDQPGREGPRGFSAVL